MRMVEIALGVLVMAAAVALAFGLTDAVVPLPPIGIGAMLSLVALGGILAIHGVIGLLLHAEDAHAPALRAAGRTGFAIAAALAIAVAVPAFVAPLNLTSLAGFPLGFYLAAQGALLALAILGFRTAQGLDAADADTAEAAGGDGEP